MRGFPGDSVRFRMCRMSAYRTCAAFSMFMSMAMMRGGSYSIQGNCLSCWAKALGRNLTRLPLITDAEYQKNPLAADVKFWGRWVLEKGRDGTAVDNLRVEPPPFVVGDELERDAFLRLVR